MIDRTITKTNGRNKVVDFRDNLIPGGDTQYAMLHGLGGAKYAAHSTIKVMICDYSGGKGNAVTVSANLAPETIEQLYVVAREAITPHSSHAGAVISDSAATDLANAKAQTARIYKGLRQKEGKSDVNIPALLAEIEKAGKMIASAMAGVTKGQANAGPEFNYSQDRVNPHAVNSGGIAPVTRMQISRNGVRNDGSISQYPWYIRITNGEAPLKKKENGSCTFDGRAFNKLKEAFINISDADMFKMMSKCQHFISVWENAICLGQVSKGVQAVKQEYTQYLSSRGGN